MIRESLRSFIIESFTKQREVLVRKTLDGLPFSFKDLSGAEADIRQVVDEETEEIIQWLKAKP